MSEPIRRYSKSSHRSAQILSVDFDSGKVVDRYRPTGRDGEIKNMSHMIQGLEDMHDMAVRDEYLRLTRTPYVFQKLVFRNVITLLKAIRSEYGDFQVCIMRGRGVSKVFSSNGKPGGHNR